MARLGLERGTRRREGRLSIHRSSAEAAEKQVIPAKAGIHADRRSIRS
jgi:hypothetical protein